MELTNVKRLHQQGGFTLIEGIMAVAVLAIMFISLFAGVAFSFNVTRFERENLRATQIMLERLEGIRLFKWTQLTNTTLNPKSFTNYYYPKKVTGQGQGIQYLGSLSVSNATLDPSATYSTNMKVVTVTLKWVSGNVQRQRSMSTYVAKHGVQNYVYSN